MGKSTYWKLDIRLSIMKIKNNSSNDFFLTKIQEKPFHRKLTIPFEKRFRSIYNRMTYHRGERPVTGVGNGRKGDYHGKKE